MHSDFIVFADESGDHSLAKIHPDYPVFVLSFCIFRRAEYFETVSRLLQQFKLRWWIHDGVVLHSLRIRRKELPFVFLKTLDTRERFMADLTDTLARCPFILIAAAIDKVRLRERDLQPENPYSLALRFCLTRAHDFLRERGQEHLSAGKDAGILHRVLRQEGELARAPDRGLVSTPIGHRVSNPQRRNRAFDRIQEKFDRGPNGELMGWGLEIFPRKTKGLDD